MPIATLLPIWRVKLLHVILCIPYNLLQIDQDVLLVTKEKAGDYLSLPSFL